MEAKFTNGPWQFHAHDGAITDCTKAENDICYMEFDGFDWAGEGYHNAHLIASAPEVYDYLDGLHESMSMNGGVIELDEDDCEYIGKLLAKARGEK